MQSILIQNIDKRELRQLVYEVLVTVLKEKISEYPQMQPPAQGVPDKLLTKKEAAQYLGISSPTLSKYIKDGYVKAHTVAGTRMRFRLTDLEKALRGLRSR